MSRTRNPYNPNGIYPGEYPSHLSHSLNESPPVFTSVNWNNPLADRPRDELVSPQSSRGSRSRVKREATGSNYNESRAAKLASRTEPVTPPRHKIPTQFYNGTPISPSQGSSEIPYEKRVRHARMNHKPGGGACIIPDQAVKEVDYVSHRGSLVPKDDHGNIRPPKPFIFDHGRQVDPQVSCGPTCAHFRFMREETYQVRKAYQPRVVKYSPVFGAKSHIVFMDRRKDIAFDYKTTRGSGVLLQDVFKPPEGFSVVDDDEVIDLEDTDHLPLNIDINGFPTSIAEISLACAHGRLTRFGLLKAVAQLFYATTHTKAPGNGESKHRNTMMPKKIKFENIRLISLYYTGGLYHAEIIYVAEKQSK